MGVFSLVITCVVIIGGLYKRDSRFLSFFLFILLWILFAFEKTEVGDGDYERYVRHYDNIAQGIPVMLEPLFWVFSIVGNYFKLNFDSARAILCFIELLLIYRTIAQFTYSRAFVLALFFIFPAFFDAELFRWFWALSIIIAGLPILMRASSVKDYIKFSLFILLASTAHSGAMVFLFLLLMAVKNKKNLYVIVVSFVVVGVITAQTGLLYKIINYLPVSNELVDDRYSSYSIGTWRSVIYTGYLLLLSIVIGYMSVARRPIQKLPVCHEFNNENRATHINVYYSGNVLLKNIKRLNVISLCLLPISLYTAQTQRLMHLFLFINYIAIAVSCERFKSANSFRVIVTLLSTILLLIWMIFFCSDGTMPVFLSHFKIGYLINFFNIIVG